MPIESLLYAKHSISSPNDFSVYNFHVFSLRKVFNLYYRWIIEELTGFLRAQAPPEPEWWFRAVVVHTFSPSIPSFYEAWPWGCYICMVSTWQMKTSLQPLHMSKSSNFLGLCTKSFFSLPLQKIMYTVCFSLIKFYV